MNRKLKETDFFIELPDIGKFRYGCRTFGDNANIRAEVLKYTGGNDTDMELNALARVISTHRVLCSEAPKGWEDLADLDVLQNPTIEDSIYTLYGRLREKEDSFRRGPTEGSETAGA